MTSARPPASESRSQRLVLGEPRERVAQRLVLGGNKTVSFCGSSTESCKRMSFCGSSTGGSATCVQGTGCST
eukprot:11189931-Alexandrium_andersonii.AAC.1